MSGSIAGLNTGVRAITINRVITSWNQINSPYHIESARRVRFQLSETEKNGVSI